MKPRPEGYDYSRPDAEHLRCLECNKIGMNRTGLKPIQYIGASTTMARAIKCPNNCNYGLKKDNT